MHRICSSAAGESNISQSGNPHVLREARSSFHLGQFLSSLCSSGMNRAFSNMMERLKDVCALKAYVQSGIVVIQHFPDIILDSKLSAPRRTKAEKFIFEIKKWHVERSITIEPTQCISYFLVANSTTVNAAEIFNECNRTLPYSV